MYERDCDKCVYHSSGSCSEWECCGTKTANDMFNEGVSMAIRAMLSMCHEWVLENEKKLSYENILEITESAKSLMIKD